MIELIAAIIASILFVALSIFQLLLALGFTLGNPIPAYGGRFEKLPKNLRIMSIIAISIFILAIISVLARSGIIAPLEDFIFFAVFTWIFAIYSAFITVMNIASKSKLEKQLMTPISLIVSICCFIVAIVA
jgi:hypothetical protein